MGTSYWDSWWSRRLSRRRVLGTGAAGATGLAAMGFAGCGDDDSGGSTPTRAASGATTSAAATSGGATTAPSAAAKKAPQGDLKVALVTMGDQSADPMVQTGGGNAAMILSCFEQFTRWNKDGVLVPALASKMEEPPDHTKLIFTLRDGATFWDGTPVTSDDVKWSFERYTTMKSADAYAPLVKAEVASVETPDKKTVVLNIAKPTVARLTRGIIAPQGWNIASQAYYAKVGEDTFKKQPMATGPFKLTGNEVQQFVKLEAYAGHYERVPGFNTIRIDVVPETTTRIARLQTGEADFIDSIFGPSRAQVAGDSSVKVYDTEATSLATIFFQQFDKPPFNDVRVRKALSLAVDQDAIIKSLYLGTGSKAPGVNIYPVTIGWDPAKIPPQEFNLDKAKASLAAAGLAAGFKTNLAAYASGGTPLIPEMMEALVGMWKKLNIDVTLEKLESAAYLAKYRARQFEGLAPVGLAANRFADFSLKYYLPSDPYGFNSPADIQAKITALGQEFDDKKYLALAQDTYMQANDQVMSITMPFGTSSWGVRKKTVANWTPLGGNPYPNAFETLIPA